MPSVCFSKIVVYKCYEQTVFEKTRAKMKWLLLALALLATVALAAPPTDLETYQQMRQFIDTHSKMPSDAVLVQRILTSERWIALDAQHGQR